MRLTFDTNILVYAADADAGERHVAAIDLVRRAVGADCVLTLQTLSELFNVTTRKLRLAARDAASLVNRLRDVFPVHPADEAVLDDAMAAIQRETLAFWDAMLWATAQQAGCRIILTEDFQDGCRLGAVTFLNPFLSRNRKRLESVLPAGE